MRTRIVTVWLPLTVLVALVFLALTVRWFAPEHIHVDAASKSPPNPQTQLESNNQVPHRALLPVVPSDSARVVRFVSADGNPVSSVRVSWSEARSADAHSDSNGVVTVPFSQRHIKAIHPNFIPVVKSLPSEPTNRAVLVILERGAEIHGDVRDEADQPIEGALVELRFGSPADDPTLPDSELQSLAVSPTGNLVFLKTCRTDTKGEYSSKGLAPGRYRAAASKRGYIPVVRGPEGKTWRVNRFIDATSGGRTFAELKLHTIYAAVVAITGEPTVPLSVLKSCVGVELGEPRGMHMFTASQRGRGRRLMTELREKYSNETTFSVPLLVWSKGQGTGHATNADAALSIDVLGKPIIEDNVRLVPLNDFGQQNVYVARVAHGLGVLANVTVRSLFPIVAHQLLGNKVSWYKFEPLESKGNSYRFILPKGRYRFGPTGSTLLLSKEFSVDHEVTPDRKHFLDLSATAPAHSEVIFEVLDKSGRPASDFLMGITRLSDGKRLLYSGLRRQGDIRIWCRPGSHRVDLREENGSLIKFQNLEVTPGRSKIKVQFPDR